ncbi:MAG TPA: peptidase M50, partial [Myxococcota bacterium]|nr:peptidase M50 [Myxococcota bacterium]
MSESLLSPSWYRVSQLRPRVRGHARFHRHRYRGQLWMVLEDPASGRSHRLSAAAYQVIGLMNGVRTTQEIWELACERLGDDAPTQEETLRLLGLLHAADVLQCDLPPDTAELLARRQRRSAQEWWRRLASPLSQRVPLFDPSPLLDRCERFVRPLFGRAGAALWCLVVGAGLLAGIAHASELAAGATRDLLEPANLLLIALAYPLVKLLHEAGHAFATRVWGGEVHEVGILFLVFFPMPYVDASASSAFSDKRKRMAVGAAGIAIELFLSSIALFLWLLVEPGWVRSLCYDVILIGGTSTLLFNGNPLMRYDGYYVLADAIEIPNLDARARQYLAYLAQRYVLGLETARNPVTATGEPRWLALYALMAIPYRFAVGIGVALFLAGRYFAIGVALALLAVGLQVVAPLLRLVHFLASSPRLAERRERAVLTAAALALASIVLVAVVPLPAWTLARGVVWPAEHAEVRAGADGFVTRLAAEPGARVSPGDPLLTVRDPAQDAELAALEAQREEVAARVDAERVSGAARARIAAEELTAADEALAHARERHGEASVRAATSGTL